MSRRCRVCSFALRKAVERADSLRASLGYIPVGETNPFAHVWHAQELPYIQQAGFFRAFSGYACRLAGHVTQ